MFSLIISIIAIALVAVLALATIYYGTDAYLDQRVEAGAAQIINESEQIEGAILAYNVEQGVPPEIIDCEGSTDPNCEPLQNLIDADYLASAPVQSGEGEVWAMAAITGTTDALVKTVPLLECETANINMGFRGVDDYNGTSPAVNLVKSDMTGEEKVNELQFSDGDMVPVCADAMPNSIVCCATAS